MFQAGVCFWVRVCTYPVPQLGDLSLDKEVPADPTLVNFDHAADANVVNFEEKTTSKVAYKPRLGDLEIPNTLRTEIRRFL